MKAIPGLVSAGSALWRNPLILAVIVPLILLRVFQPTTSFFTLGDSSSPLFISLGVWSILLLVTVFFNGGIYGMAQQALDGRTSLENFLQEARGNYVRLLLGTLLRGGISIVTTIVGALVIMVIAALVVFGLAGIARGSTPLQVTGGGGIALFFLLLWFVPLLGSLVVTAPVLFFIQFFDAAIVVDDTRTFESFRRSAGLVRRNLLSTLGYSLFRGMIWILSLLVSLSSVYLTSPGQNGGTQPWLAGLVDSEMFYVLSSLQIGLLLIIGVFWRTYKISYYNEMIAAE